MERDQIYKPVTNKIFVMLQAKVVEVLLATIQFSLLLAGKPRPPKMSVISIGYPRRLSEQPRQQGSVFVLGKLGKAVFIEMNVAAFVVRGGRWDDTTTVATIDVSQAPNAHMMAQTVSLSNALPRDNTVEILRRLINKALPYAYYRCHEDHYMNYFLGGDPMTASWVYSQCLQGLPLAKVSLAQIKSSEFTLSTKSGSKKKVSTLDKYE